MSVISYSYNLGDFVKDFYELSMISISYELELNPGIISNPTDQESVKAQSSRYTVGSLLCCFFTVFGF